MKKLVKVLVLINKKLVKPGNVDQAQICFLAVTDLANLDDEIVKRAG